MQLGIPGTKRITAQQHLVPSNTAIRVYKVDYVSTTTNTALYLCDNDGTNASSTAVALPIIPVYAQGSGVSGIGHWHSDVGVKFDDGVLVFTSTNFSFASITYSTEF